MPATAKRADAGERAVAAEASAERERPPQPLDHAGPAISRCRALIGGTMVAMNWILSMTADRSAETHKMIVRRHQIAAGQRDQLAANPTSKNR
jgi:hypothetical protein